MGGGDDNRIGSVLIWGRSFSEEDKFGFRHFEFEGSEKCQASSWDYDLAQRQECVRIYMWFLCLGEFRLGAGGG